MLKSQSLKKLAQPLHNAALILLASTLLGCNAGDNANRTTGTAESIQHSLIQHSLVRERILLNNGWRFMRYDADTPTDNLIYDELPEVLEKYDGKPADAQPTEAAKIERSQTVLKPWILPTANNFIKDPAKHYIRPEGNPGNDFAFVKKDFDDTHWEAVTIPHDWAIAGPFMQGDDVLVGGGMGRLPSVATAWYRKTLAIPQNDEGKRLYLDIDGAMSYAMVWLNGHLVGGWPYGYASWRLDLTPYIKFGADNQIAIRMNNPKDSSRWYQGGGLYRNVWLTKTQPIHVGLWGTHIATTSITPESATVQVTVSINNQTADSASVTSTTEIYALNSEDQYSATPVAKSRIAEADISGQSKGEISYAVTIDQPKLWGPPPTQTPNRYIAITTLEQNHRIIDRYETRFGLRDLEFNPEKGLFVNGEPVYIQGVNQHHDLGALGGAFNLRAAERQLQLLREMGVNAIRLAHNPPAPELLELTDKMGFLVVDEIFDVWERKKAPLDFHLIFPEWYEADLRSFIRRDRNHPSVIMWSVGNEVGEQYTDKAGAKLAQTLVDIVKEEDISRPTAASMNYAKPDMPLPAVFDTISLNYQGEGIRNAPAYQHLKGIRTAPLYPAFHKAFPNKLIFSSENAAAVSSRGEYFFPVSENMSAPAEDGAGANPITRHVSAYELYTAPFGSSADKVLASLAKHSYVGGGFIWSGWDYLGEPTPYYSSRSSYFGVIDLAGFKKDRFYLYQAAWRPDLPMAHILPHWNWPDRHNKVTPVHVFTTGDEAELFLNGKSLGRKQKEAFSYRLRWDNVIYEPGELEVIAYKNGKYWAKTSVATTGKASGLSLTPDRSTIKADAKDLSFVTVKITDSDGVTVPTAKHQLTFSLDGPGEIVATDNGDPTDMTSFKSLTRNAFNGLALVIIRGQATKPGTNPGTNPGTKAGTLTLTVSGTGLGSVSTQLETQP